MPIFKTIEDITEYDLLNLIDGVENESKVLDYKVFLQLDEEKAKDEYRRDITSFANASGGDIIIGMKEDADGKPVELTGFDLGHSKAEQYQIRLIELCQSKITPRIQGLRAKLIELRNGKHAAIIRIPRSLNRPHQVEIGNKDFQFWQRHDRTKQRMDIEDLKQSISSATNISGKMRKFRQERLQKISENKTSIPLHKGAKVVLHIIPLSAFELDIRFDLDILDTSANRPLMYPIYSGRSADMRPNLDGMFIHDKRFENETGGSYVQVYRNGIIEAVEATFFCGPNGKDKEPRGINGKYFEDL